MVLAEFVGKVVSDKMMKTVTVAVTRTYQHPKIGKFLRRTKKFMAHDEAETCREGDTVRIIETPPISKMKRWTVIDVLQRAPVFPDLPSRTAADAITAAAAAKGDSLLPPAAAAAKATSAA